MANLKELRDERLRKLEELKKLGINPYPAKAHRTHGAGEIIEGFDKLDGKPTTVAGRIVSIRKFGKLAFVVLKDASGSIQLFLKEGELASTDPKLGIIGLDHLSLLDSGDFVEASGLIAKTKTGEISVMAEKLRLLTKSLRGMPTAQEGFTNKEERLRRRYIDTNVNPDVYKRFLRRSKFWQATRDFLNGEGFTEINIPVLEQTTGGADANPFVTHMDALGQDYVLAARAKGLTEARVVMVHALRNSLIPVVSVIALGAPQIFGGAVITEQIFGVNGVGQLLITSIAANDLPMVQSVLFLLAVLIVLANLLADLVYAMLDPRVRYD